MNEDIANEILNELRKLSKHAEYARKLQKRYLIFVLIFLPFLFGGIFYFENKVKKDYKVSETAPENWDWSKVTDDEEGGRLDAALEKAQYLVELSPHDYYGYDRLGFLYLQKNELRKAKESFEKAYDIWPHEKNKKYLNAIIEKINKENGS